MKILVTGASGYIGCRIIALSKKHNIVAASRKPLKPLSSWRHYDFNMSPKISLPADIDAVIHLAAKTSGKEDDKQNEITAAQDLIEAANQIGAKFVFVSSQTAREDAPTNYGRIKWRIEQDVLAAGGQVVRFGQVYGVQEKGLFGTLVKIVRSLRVLPAFIPSPLIQPIHVDDCAEGLLRLIEAKTLPSAIFSIASSEPISFTDLLRSIAMNWVGDRRIYIPVPIWLVRLFSKIIGEQFASRYGLDRLNSLFDLPLMETKVDLNTLGIKLRTLHSGMIKPVDDQKNLTREGSALLTYLLKETPDSELVERYVSMVKQLRGGVFLDLPGFLFRWPIALSWLDDRRFISSPEGGEFGWRIDAASVIAEASVQGAGRFLGNTGPKTRLLTLIRMAAAICSEFMWVTLRFVFPFSFFILIKKRFS